MKCMRELAISILVTFSSVGCATTSVATLESTVYSIDCDDLGSYASELDDGKYVVKFLNSRDETLDLYWINYEAEEVFYKSISPRETYTQNTYLTHPWVVRDKSGLCVAAYDSKASVLVKIR